MNKLTIFLILSILFIKVGAAKLSEKSHVSSYINTSLKVDYKNAKEMLITEEIVDGKRFYRVNGELLKTKRKIKNYLDYTIPYADGIRVATNGIGVGLGFTIVTVIPLSKLLGVPMLGGYINSRDRYIDLYNSYVIKKFGLGITVPKFYK